MTAQQDSPGGEISRSARFYWRIARWIALLVAAFGLLAQIRENGVFGRPFAPFLQEWLAGFDAVTSLIFVPLADGIIQLERVSRALAREVRSRFIMQGVFCDQPDST